MRIPGRLLLFVLSAILIFSSVTKATDDLEDIDFDEEANGDDKISTSLKTGDNVFKTKEDKVRNAVKSAMKTPEKRDQLSQVLPIIRSMSQPQKLAMAAMVSSRISNNETTPASFEEIQSLFGGSNRENATRELMLPISMDIAKIISDDVPEELPEAQELRYGPPGIRRRPVYHTPSRRPASLNRRNVHPEGPRPAHSRPIRRPNDVKRGPTDKECTFFSNTVCLEAMDYPREAIIRSIRSNKEMVTALLTDYPGQENGGLDDGLPVALPLENRYENRFENNEIKRRSDSISSIDNVEEGFTCPSQVRYARPQLARAASGVWKYIINTGEHTQTLRLEKCTHPQGTCAFISENYRSSCVQVYNYHRLLTWDSTLGLHMDIFKVPSCCSCHVHGYSDIFPPHRKNPPMKSKESFPGADFATEDQNDEFNKPSNFITKPSANPNLDPISKYANESPSAAFFDDVGDKASFQLFDKKPYEDSSVIRPSFALPGRPRPKKQPGSVPRPYENLPQQHAPNTRAPGYTGPLNKGTRPGRPNRPFRRESTSHLEYPGNRRNATSTSRYSQEYDQDVDATTRIQYSASFDDDYQEPTRRVNYNYHPIIDFFKPEASMLQSAQPQLATQPAPVQSSDSWKPMIST